MKPNESDKSICKWSTQVDDACPYEELLNMLVNSVSEKKIRCDKKECLNIIKKRGIKNDKELLEKTDKTDYMKPGGPATTTRLLNQFNIDNVLYDFSIATINENGVFKNGPFFHIRFEMRDFMEAFKSELRDVDFGKLIDAGFKSFGCVLNTDVWAGPGKHWVCIFGTIEDKKIRVEYFNSSGNGLDQFPEIRKWVEFKKETYDIDIEEVVKKTLQYSETECGVWCLCYIKSRLEGHPKDYFYKYNVDDDDIIKMRKYLFSE